LLLLKVVKALHYLYKKLHVIHRDVKPSNILISRQGRIKMCDFGISGYLINSVAKTIDAGCSKYMAPERIDPFGDPSKYDIRSDIWSLGISLIEISTGNFPYKKWSSPFEQLKEVVTSDPPVLPKDAGFSSEYQDFVFQWYVIPIDRKCGPYLAENSYKIFEILTLNSSFEI
jgi:serine/threonine protein kinase